MRVDEMKAGRELDVLVAKAMGARIVDCWGGPPVFGVPVFCLLDERVRPISYYSTDVAAILPAAEQVVGTGHIKIKLLPADKDHKQCLATVRLWLGRANDVHTLAEGATGEQAIALALARAVVKAKGVEEAAT